MGRGSWRTWALALLGAVAASLLAAASGAAQLPTASAAPTGTGQNYVARISGFGAIGLNPARLAMPATPSWSVSVPAGQAALGLDPIGLGDLARYSGKLIPDDVKQEWLEEIIQRGGERGLATVAATGLSGTLGRFGVQLSTFGLFRGDLNEDAAEIALFGNRGRGGEARTFLLNSSAIDGFWVSTLAVAGGFPVDVTIGSSEDQRLALGATLKLHFGHTAVVTRDVSGFLEPDPPVGEVSFPSIQTRETSLDNGFGVGLDLAAAWEVGRWSLGLNLQNLFNTFGWDFSELSYRKGDARFDRGRAASSFAEIDVAEAPDDLVRAVEDSDFDPVLVGGAAFQVRPNLSLLADFQHRFGQGLAVSTRNRIGAGAEWGAAKWLILRAGGSVVTDGYRLGGGVGLVLGPVNLAGSYLTQGGTVENAELVAVTLSLKAQ